MGRHRKHTPKRFHGGYDSETGDSSSGYDSTSDDEGTGSDVDNSGFNSVGYDSEEDFGKMEYNAYNSHWVPFSKKESEYYDKEWTEWRGEKPTHDKEWPASMHFTEQLNYDETHAASKSASTSEFWGKEDPWDYYRNLKGASYQHLGDFTTDDIQKQKGRMANRNVYSYEKDAISENGVESRADLAEGEIYTRSDDVMTSSGRDRYVSLQQKSVPVVMNDAPRGNRDANGGIPWLGIIRGPRKLPDIETRDNHRERGTNDAPPVMPDMRYPSVRENKFAWKSFFGVPDGGYSKEGDSLRSNDVSLGMKNRRRSGLLPIVGLPLFSNATGEGDSLQTNRFDGNRMRAGGGDTKSTPWISPAEYRVKASGWNERVDDVVKGGRLGHADKFSNLQRPSNAVPPNELAGWDTRVDDVYADGGGRAGRNSGKPLSNWGENAVSRNGASGWNTRQDDIIQGGKLGRAAKFLSWWGENPVSRNGVGGWNTRQDDISSGGRIGRAGKFLHHFGETGVTVPITASGWDTRQDDVSAGNGRIGRPSLLASIWGSNPKYINAASGWDERQDSMVEGGRFGRGSGFLSWWGENPRVPFSASGWETKQDDISAGGKWRHEPAMLSWWGAGPSATQPSSGVNLETNDVVSGARTSDRSTNVRNDYMQASAPVTSYGGADVNMTSTGSLGRRVETTPASGVRGPAASGGIFNGFFSVGRVYERIRDGIEDFTGARSGAVSGAYMPFSDFMEKFSGVNNRGVSFASTEPDERLTRQAMRGLGSKTITDMSKKDSFDDLSPKMSS